jgi:hypothetical protein
MIRRMKAADADHGKRPLEFGGLGWVVFGSCGVPLSRSGWLFGLVGCITFSVRFMTITPGAL